MKYLNYDEQPGMKGTFGNSVSKTLTQLYDRPYSKRA
jgi:hypothetical protein